MSAKNRDRKRVIAKGAFFFTDLRKRRKDLLNLWLSAPNRKSLVAEPESPQIAVKAGSNRTFNHATCDLNQIAVKTGSNRTFKSRN